MIAKINAFFDKARALWAKAVAWTGLHPTLVLIIAIALAWVAVDQGVKRGIANISCSLHSAAVVAPAKK